MFQVRASGLGFLAFGPEFRVEGLGAIGALGSPRVSLNSP